MKSMTVVKVLGFLLVFGLFLLSAEAVWSEDLDQQYEVTVPAELVPELPDMLTEQAVRVMCEMGWLRPVEGGKIEGEFLANKKGNSCHLIYWYCGAPSYCIDCVAGAGDRRCSCMDAVM